MNKKINAIICILILIFTIIFMTNNFVYASDTPSEIIQDAQDFVKDPVDATDAKVFADSSNIQKTSKVVNAILLTVAILVSVVTLALLGINFMVQSAEEKAKVKEAMIPFSVGALIAFGAYGIWRIVVKLFIDL